MSTHQKFTARVNNHVIRGVPWSETGQAKDICRELECSWSAGSQDEADDSGLFVPLGAECSFMKGSRGELESRLRSRLRHEGTLRKT